MSNYRYKNIPQKIFLTEDNKNKRIEQINKWIFEGIQWGNVIFTDEKLFNMDGPNNYYSWVKDEEINLRRKRHSGGGGLMVHGLISLGGKFEVRRVDGYINAEKYIQILDEIIIYIKNKRNSNFILMHDNAPPHRARITKDFLDNKRIERLNWPPYSPDLNIIENLWGILSQKVYYNVQYVRKEDLWKSILKAVEEINEDKNIIPNLYQSIPSRFNSCIKKNGDII